MLHLLKRHPWSITARFDWSLALVYSVPWEVVAGLLPPGLSPDLHEDQAFVAAAFVQTRNLRPIWAPSCLSQDFFLAGWRAFVRARLPDGRTVRGLYILASDTDSRFMAASGRLLTHYDYRKVAVESLRQRDQLALTIRDCEGGLLVDLSAQLEPATAPPVTSIFRDLRVARRFAGPMPFTFSYEEQTDSLIVVEGARQHWEPRPVDVHVRCLDRFQRPPFVIHEELPPLANAFWVEDVVYFWKRGRRIPAHLSISSVS